MIFSPKCRTNKFEMIYTILGSFRSFFNWGKCQYSAPNRAFENPFQFHHVSDFVNSGCHYNTKTVHVYVLNMLTKFHENRGPVTHFFFKLINLTLYLIETPFNTFANRADPDQTALVI